MKDDQKVLKYNVAFNQLAAVAHWDDRALLRQYYKGLPDRLKDELVHVDKATTTVKLRQQVHAIDARYWARKTEQSRNSGKNPGNNTDKSAKSGGNPSSSDNNSSGKKKKKPNTSNNSGNSSNNNNNRASDSKGNNSGSQQKKPDLSNKLGKDGKLTAEERQRRFTNNLCMFCGGSGHVAKDCPRSTSKATKAKSASVSEAGPSAPKKD
jgi:hypothetical protein